MQEIFVQVKINETVPEIGQEYNDTFYYPFEEWPVKQEIIDEEKNKRIANLVDSIKNPPVAVEPTEEYMSNYIDELEKQKHTIISQIDATQTEYRTKLAVATSARLIKTPIIGVKL